MSGWLTIPDLVSGLDNIAKCCSNEGDRYAARVCDEAARLIEAFGARDPNDVIPNSPEPSPGNCPETFLTERSRRGPQEQEQAAG
jgi:hypothetical protein